MRKEAPAQGCVAKAFWRVAETTHCIVIQKTNGNRGMWLCVLEELPSSVSVQPWPDVTGDDSKGRNLICS